MSVLAVLTSAESRRLIGRGLAAHPDVVRANKKGRILVSGSSTTGFFVEELLGEKIDVSHFICGVITDGVVCMTPDERIRNYYIVDGQVQDHDYDLPAYEEMRHFVSELGPGDVCIKAANAIDATGMAGILLAHPLGGNILLMLPKVVGTGTKLIIPAGLEKLVPSVREAQKHMLGVRDYRYTYGRGCGYIALDCGEVFTEISAIELLTGATAYHVASGGTGGSEGAVTLVIEGTDEQEEAAIELIGSVKGEPPVGSWKKNCATCDFKCAYRHGR